MAVTGVAALGIAATIFLRNEGLERASWWAGVVGALVTAVTAAHQISNRNPSTTEEVDEKPAGSYGHSVSNSSIGGDNIQMGDRVSNIQIGRDGGRSANE